MLVDQIKRHWYYNYNNDFIVGSIEQFIAQMSKEVTFGDNITLVALARELNCQFILIHSRGPGYHRVVSNSGSFDRDIETFIRKYIIYELK